MSNFKNIESIHQKTHRERHQPEERAELGILEKKADYKARTEIVKNKQNKILALQRLAYVRNPDEYVPSMVRLRHKNNAIIKMETEEEAEDTLNQKLLMESRTINYVNMKRIVEYKQINKMQSNLHMSELAKIVDRTHVKFDEKGNVINQNSEDRALSYLADKPSLDKFDLRSLSANKVELLKEIKRREYLKLARKVERHEQLNLIYQKMKVQKDLRKPSYMKPKLEKRGTPTSAPVYKWMYERKR